MQSSDSENNFDLISSLENPVDEMETPMRRQDHRPTPKKHSRTPSKSTEEAEEPVEGIEVIAPFQDGPALPGKSATYLSRMVDINVCPTLDTSAVNNENIGANMTGNISKALSAKSPKRKSGGLKQNDSARNSAMSVIVGVEGAAQKAKAPAPVVVVSSLPASASDAASIASTKPVTRKFGPSGARASAIRFAATPQHAPDSDSSDGGGSVSNNRTPPGTTGGLMVAPTPGVHALARKRNAGRTPLPKTRTMSASPTESEEDEEGSADADNEAEEDQEGVRRREDSVDSFTTSMAAGVEIGQSFVECNAPSSVAAPVSAPTLDAAATAGRPPSPKVSFSSLTVSVSAPAPVSRASSPKVIAPAAAPTTVESRAAASVPVVAAAAEEEEEEEHVGEAVETAAPAEVGIAMAAEPLVAPFTVLDTITAAPSDEDELNAEIAEATAASHRLVEVLGGRKTAPTPAPVPAVESVAVVEVVSASVTAAAPVSAPAPAPTMLFVPASSGRALRAGRPGSGGNSPALSAAMASAASASASAACAAEVVGSAEDNASSAEAVQEETGVEEEEEVSVPAVTAEPAQPSPAAGSNSSAGFFAAASHSRAVNRNRQPCSSSATSSFAGISVQLPQGGKPQAALSPSEASVSAVSPSSEDGGSSGRSATRKPLPAQLPPAPSTAQMEPTQGRKGTNAFTPAFALPGGRNQHQPYSRMMAQCKQANWMRANVAEFEQPGAAPMPHREAMASLPLRDTSARNHAFPAASPLRNCNIATAAAAVSVPVTVGEEEDGDESCSVGSRVPASSCGSSFVYDLTTANNFEIGADNSSREKGAVPVVTAARAPAPKAAPVPAVAEVQDDEDLTNISMDSSASIGTTVTMNDAGLAMCGAGSCLDSPAGARSTTVPTLLVGSKRALKNASAAAAASATGGDMKELLLVGRKIGEPTTIKLTYGNTKPVKGCSHSKASMLVIKSRAIFMRFDSFHHSGPGVGAETDGGSEKKDASVFNVSPYRLKVAAGCVGESFVTFVPTAYGIFGGALKLRVGTKSFVLLLRAECKPSQNQLQAPSAPLSNIKVAPQNDQEEEEEENTVLGAVAGADKSTLSISTVRSGSAVLALQQALLAPSALDLLGGYKSPAPCRAATPQPKYGDNGRDKEARSSLEMLCGYKSPAPASSKPVPIVPREDVEGQQQRPSSLEMLCSYKSPAPAPVTAPTQAKRDEAAAEEATSLDMLCNYRSPAPGSALASAGSARRTEETSTARLVDNNSSGAAATSDSNSDSGVDHDNNDKDEDEVDTTQQQRWIRSWLAKQKRKLDVLGPSAPAAKSAPSTTLRSAPSTIAGAASRGGIPKAFGPMRIAAANANTPVSAASRVSRSDVSEQQHQNSYDRICNFVNSSFAATHGHSPNASTWAQKQRKPSPVVAASAPRPAPSVAPFASPATTMTAAQTLLLLRRNLSNQQHQSTPTAEATTRLLDASSVLVDRCCNSPDRREGPNTVAAAVSSSSVFETTLDSSSSVGGAGFSRSSFLGTPARLRSSPRTPGSGFLSNNKLPIHRPAGASASPAEPVQNIGDAFDSAVVHFAAPIVDFGTVRVGGLSRQKVELRNPTDAAVTVCIEDPPLPFVILHNTITLQPRSFVQMPVRFIPASGGSAEHRVSMTATVGKEQVCVQLMGRT